MAEFRINYDKVIRQANTMSELSRDLDNEIKELDEILSLVRANWKGPASTAFQNHLSILIADMRQTRYSMSSVSSTIKNVANRIQREDERQAERARRLAEMKNC